MDLWQIKVVSRNGYGVKTRYGGMSCTLHRARGVEISVHLPVLRFHPLPSLSVIEPAGSKDNGNEPTYV